MRPVDLNPYDSLKDAAEAMAVALRDYGHDEAGDDEDGSCLGCSALAQYAKALEA